MKNYNLLIFITGIFLLLPAAGINTYYLSLFSTSFIIVLFTLSWDLLGGICGQLSLGQALFFGIGSYSFTILSTYIHLPVLIALAATLLISFIVALLTGFFATRLSGAFFAIFTLALAEIAHELSLNIVFPSPEGISIGGEGGIPLLQGTGVLDPASVIREYYIYLVLVIVSACLLRTLLSTPTGMKMKSIAANEILSLSCGVRTSRIKLIAYSLSALIASICGIMLVIHTGRATHFDFSIELSFQGATLAALGGRGKIIGPGVAAFFVTAGFALLEVPPPLKITLYALLLPLVLLKHPLKLLAHSKG